MLLRTATGGTPVTATSGSLAGEIAVRDTTLAAVQTSLDSLAATFVTQVNAIHATGFAVGGTTGNNFFTGTAWVHQLAAIGWECEPLSAIARMQQHINIVPRADRNNRDAALFIIDVVRKPELQRRDLDLVHIRQPVQGIFGNTRINQPLFLEFLPEAFFNGFIQLAPLPFSVGVDGKLIAHRA